MQTPYPDTDPPEGLDWDTWLGPAPYHHYNRNHHMGWGGFWETGGGELTNWAPHLIDIVHWGLDVDAPRTVVASGGSLFLPEFLRFPIRLRRLTNIPAPA